jgi:hypothetical protein
MGTACYVWIGLKRATEVMSGDRRWCHRSIRRNYRTCGPCVVKISRVTWLLHGIWLILYLLLTPRPSFLLFFISLFIIFFCVVFFLFGDSPASEFYVPTFRNTLAVPSSQVTRPRPMKKEQNVPKRLHITLDAGESPKRKNTTFTTRRMFEIQEFFCLHLLKLVCPYLLLCLSCFLSLYLASLLACPDLTRTVTASTIDLTECQRSALTGQCVFGLRYVS